MTQYSGSPAKREMICGDSSTAIAIVKRIVAIARIRQIAKMRAPLAASRPYVAS